jgi:hypothetical protein
MSTAPAASALGDAPAYNEVFIFERQLAVADGTADAGYGKKSRAGSKTSHSTYPASVSVASAPAGRRG